MLTEIINSSGDGTCSLTRAHGIVPDGSGTVYVTGYDSDTVFRVDAMGPECILSLPPVAGIPAAPDQPVNLAIDRNGFLYVTGGMSDEVVRVDTTTDPVTVTTIIDATGDGLGNILDGPTGIVTDRFGNVYVTGQQSHNVFQIAPNGTVTEVMSECGDGQGNLLRGPNDLAVDEDGNVYVTGELSSNAFRIDAVAQIPALPVGPGIVLLAGILGAAGACLRRRVR